MSVIAETSKTIPLPAGGWLRSVRQALGASQTSVAARAGITQQAYAQFETGESAGTISLGRLRHAAAAMDCDLIYFVIPRREQARPVAEPALVPTVSQADEKPKGSWSQIQEPLPVELL